MDFQPDKLMSALDHEMAAGTMTRYEALDLFDEIADRGDITEARFVVGVLHQQLELRTRAYQNAIERRLDKVNPIPLEKVGIINQAGFWDGE